MTTRDGGTALSEEFWLGDAEVVPVVVRSNAVARAMVRSIIVVIFFLGLSIYYL